VRNARELSADDDEFTVTEDVLRRVEQLWASRLEPQRVRAQAYKINIYGPGGRFLLHRDTPERALVGTFLLMLYGDDSRYALVCHPPFPLHAGQACYWYGAHSGWCAFYPDVPHSVEPRESGPHCGGVRITLAFKIFAADEAVDRIPLVSPSRGTAAQHSATITVTGAAAAAAAVATQGEVKDNSASVPVVRGVTSLGATSFRDRCTALRMMSKALLSFPRPFGIVLHHQYSVDARVLNGVDALLLEALQKMVACEPTYSVHAFPVVVHYRHAMFVEEAIGDRQEPSDIISHVFPLTSAHMDALSSATAVDPSLFQRAELLAAVHAMDDPMGEDGIPLNCDVPPSTLLDVPAAPTWLRSLSARTPFYSVRDVRVDGRCFQHHFIPGGYMGNGSRPESVDSIYVHWAVVCVPMDAT
jgi:hypothetical protein